MSRTAENSFEKVAADGTVAEKIDNVVTHAPVILIGQKLLQPAMRSVWDSDILHTFPAFQSRYRNPLLSLSGAEYLPADAALIDSSSTQGEAQRSVAGALPIRLPNPYVLRSVIDDRERFVGRDEILQTIAAFLEKEPVLLFGHRRTGKSSLLRQLEVRLQLPYVQVYFDLQPYCGSPVALDRLLVDLSGKIARTVSRHVPSWNSEEWLKRIASSEKAETTFFDEFLPAVLQEFHERCLILAFDEFDTLDLAENPTLLGSHAAAPVGSEAHPALSLISRLHRLAASSLALRLLMVIGRRPEELSLAAYATLGASRSLYIPFLNAEETRQLIQRGEQNQALFFAEDAIERIIQCSAGHPLFVQVICDRIWHELQPTGGEPRLVTDTLIDGLLPDCLDRVSDVLEAQWNSLTSHEKYALCAVPELVPFGTPCGMDAIVQALCIPASQRIVDIKDALNGLCRWHLLRREGDGYSVAIYFTDQWIRKNKPLANTIQEIALDAHLREMAAHARLFLDKQDLEAAAYQYQALLRLRQEDGAAWMQLARIRGLQQDAPRQIEALTHAVGLRAVGASAQLSAARHSLAQILVQRGELQEAIRQCEELLLSDPEDQQAALLLGNLQMQLAGRAVAAGELDRATEIMQSGVVERHGNRVSRNALLRSLAEARLRRREWAAGQQLAQRVLAQNPQQPEWLAYHLQFERGTRLAQRYRAALEALEQRHPLLAVQGFAEIVAIQPDYADASTKLLRLLQESTLKEDYERGNTAFGQRRLLEAASHYGRVLLHNPDYSDIQSRVVLALLEHQVGLGAEVRAVWRKRLQELGLVIAKETSSSWLLLLGAIVTGGLSGIYYLSTLDQHQKHALTTLEEKVVQIKESVQLLKSAIPSPSPVATLPAPAVPRAVAPPEPPPPRSIAADEMPVLGNPQKYVPLDAKHEPKVESPPALQRDLAVKPGYCEYERLTFRGRPLDRVAAGFGMTGPGQHRGVVNLEQLRLTLRTTATAALLQRESDKAIGFAHWGLREFSSKTSNRAKADPWLELLTQAACQAGEPALSQGAYNCVSAPEVRSKLKTSCKTHDIELRDK